MSSKVMYTCDHCGAKCKGDEYASTGRWDEPGIIVFGKTVHGCSREHLGIALAKMFGIGVNGEADELLNRKQRELTKLADANSFLVTEHDNMRARIAELEARMPANEVTNVERAQYDRTIELQRKRIEELQANADGLERDRRHCVEAISESNLVPPGRTLVEGIGELVRLHRHAAKKIAELEKCILRPVSVDGKTPGEVALEAWNPGANGYSAYRDDWERAALAVLRAFGNQPSQTPQTNAGAVAMYEATKDAARRAFPDEPQAITLPTKPTKPLREDDR